MLRAAIAAALLCAAVPAHAVTGTASWYGKAHHGRLTASGERFDMTRATCATPTFRSGHKPYTVRVTNLANGRSTTCRVNDRMSRNGRIIDVSKGVAERLGFVRAGLAKVRVTRP
ncbi:MAG: septal ring lytic transglycosylase RlpA family protein [Rhizobiaceae bacterium]|nr:septal ring lytic transglycosylase RlpA family protein [Rhizobiaceae bacterium]